MRKADAYQALSFTLSKYTLDVTVLLPPDAFGDNCRPFTINWMPWAKVTFDFGANLSVVTPLTTPLLCSALIFDSAGSPLMSEKAKADAPKDTLAARMPHAIVIFFALIWKEYLFIVPHLLSS
ncbi:hypothetical protein D3C87_1476230 [compost metagenome]